MSGEPVPVPTGPSTFSGIRALIANYRSGGGTSIRASAAASPSASASSSSSASEASSASVSKAAANAEFPTRNEIAELADAQDELRAAMDDDAFGGGSASHGAVSSSSSSFSAPAGEEGGASTLSATELRLALPGDVVLSKKRDLIDGDSDDDGCDGDKSASSMSSASSSTAEVLGARLASDKEMDEQWTHVVPRVRILQRG